MSNENMTIVRSFFEIMACDQRVPEELLGPEFVYHLPGSPPLDLKATRQRMDSFSGGFSESMHHLEDMVAEGDRVAFQSRLEMIHTGEFMGVVGNNEQVAVVEMGFMRIANGKVAKMWGLLDTMGLLQKIGALL